MNRILIVLSLFVAFVANCTCLASAKDPTSKKTTKATSSTHIRDDERSENQGKHELKSDVKYKIDFKLVEVKEDVDIKKLAIKVHPHLDGIQSSMLASGHSFSNLKCSQCHSLAGVADSNAFFLRMLLDRNNSMKTWVKNSKNVKVLASRAMNAYPNRTAVIHIKSPRKLQYFQEVKKGVYSLKDEEITTGIRIESMLEQTGEDKIRLKPLSVSVTAVKGREPLEGVKLPVGKPILTTTSIETSLLCKLGKSSVISIGSPRGGRILISIKVTRIGKRLR